MASIELKSYDPPSAMGLMRSIVAIIFRAISLILTVALATGVGVWSSRYMISRGSPLSADMYGPWQHWRDLGRESADPYSKAHLASTGTLRISADSAGIF